MVDSSVDVCDLMIELLCKGCTHQCPSEPSDDETVEIWSHSKLMDCIRQHVKVRPWLVFTDADIISTFEGLRDGGVLENKIPEDFDIKPHLADIKAELPVDSMIVTVNERLYDEVLIYLEAAK